ISPEAPVPVLHVRSIRTVPGGAANTAANISALGGQPVLVSAIGEDIAGATLRQLLEDRSVPCVLLADDRPTVRKVRALGGQQQLLRLDFEGDGVASAVLRPSFVEALAWCVSAAAAIVVSDYAKGLLDAGTVDAIRSLARRSEVPLVIDPRPEHGAWYRGCDYLTPNWKEALSLAGIVEPWPPDNERIDSVGRQLVE